MIKKSIQTQEIIPRYYGAVFERGNNALFIPPTSFVFGEVLRTDPKKLREYVIEWQKYKSKHQGDYTRGQPVHRPLFPIDDYEDLLYCNPNIVVEAIQEGLLKKYKSKNMWLSDNEKAIINGHLGNTTLTADIKTRYHGGKKNKKPYWKISMDSPLVLNGSYRFNAESCQCDDHFWGGVKKGVKVLCTHLAAGMNQLYDDDLNIIKSEKVIDRDVWLPFNFIDKYGSFDEQLTPYMEINEAPERSSLIIDVMIASFVKNENSFYINKRLAQIPEIYNPGLISGIENGDFSFGVLHQKKKNIKTNPDYENAIRYLRREMELKLKKQGYTENRVNVLEFDNTRWETVCPEWTNGKHIIRTVFSNKFPPLYTVRKVGDGDVNIFQPMYDMSYHMSHPFSKLDNIQADKDDKTRRLTSTKVSIPSEINIPDIIKSEYKEQIEAFYPGNKRQIINKSGL